MRWQASLVVRVRFPSGALVAKKQTDPGLKINVSWEEAARRMLATKPESVPPRPKAKRKRAKSKTAKR